MRLEIVKLALEKSASLPEAEGFLTRYVGVVEHAPATASSAAAVARSMTKVKVKRVRRVAQAAQKGKRWTINQDRRLVQARIDEKLAWRQIAQEVKRTVGACMQRYYNLRHMDGVRIP